jgi:hypothetical protein
MRGGEEQEDERIQHSASSSFLLLSILSFSQLNKIAFSARIRGK